MAPKDTSLPPKVRKMWQNSGIEITPSANDNLDRTERPLPRDSQNYGQVWPDTCRLDCQ